MTTNHIITDPALANLRAGVEDVDPSLLTGDDIKAMLGLMLAAYQSQSRWGETMRADDAAREAAAEEWIELLH